MRQPVFLISWLAGVATAATLPPPACNTSFAQTEYGPVYTTNHTESGVTVYKGIPYAPPPVGDLRWKSPAPPTSWTVPVNATEAKTHCYLFSAGIAIGAYSLPTVPSEDCLYLNIWTTAQSSDKPLPVMVYVHGGGFQTDSATSTSYDGTFFAEQGVLLVKNNIAHFGGNPENVTVFGESAGGHAIGILMTSPLASGLFDKAIMKSGTWWDTSHGTMSTFEEARTRGEEWGNMVAPNATLAELRSLPAEKVVDTSQWNPLTDPAVTAFSPSIDNYVNLAAPATVWGAGKQMKIPLMAGWVAREDTIFQSFALPHTSASVFNAARDEYFTIGPLLRPSTYAYHFTYTSAFNPIAGHTTGLPFLFRTFSPETHVPGYNYSLTPSSEDIAFGKKLMTYWTNFAKSGDPNLPVVGLPHWPMLTPGDGASDNALLQLGNMIEAAQNAALDRFHFIRSLRNDGVLPVTWRTYE
ncbi:Carboxylesterase [Xylariaceae sp. FL0255]|nr:Carboxylesterase [Xylariaceae sp. FL0255]